MKNIHVLQEKIYITSDEEIKEGDWSFNEDTNIVAKCIHIQGLSNGSYFGKKIILTTDQDLIKDGVQAIDDEFLEWFVKNPSCEEVEVESERRNWKEINYIIIYKIIIPKKEPKQETLVERMIPLQLKYNLLMIKSHNNMTAVEWLYNNLKSHFEHDGDLLEVVQFSFEQAKEMEREQLNKRYLKGIEVYDTKFKTNKIMKQTENISQFSKKSNNLLIMVKYAYNQYKNDLRFVKYTSRIWKQKPYKFLLTELSILWHNIYWRVIKQFKNK